MSWSGAPRKDCRLLLASAHRETMWNCSRMVQGDNGPEALEDLLLEHLYPLLAVACHTKGDVTIYQFFSKLSNHAVDTIKNIIFRTYLEHLAQIAKLKITTIKRIIFTRKLADQIKLESQDREIRYDVCLLRCLSSVKSGIVVSWAGFYTFIFSWWPSPGQVFSKVR